MDLLIQQDFAKREADRLELERLMREGKKSLLVGSDEAGGYAFEADGGILHPTLAGVPVKLRRVRNESGKFDKLNPDKVRTDRATARTLMGKV